MSKHGWIGVDLDGTLAYYDKWRGIEYIGDPIPSMLFRIKKWLADGIKVKIFTARACTPEAIPYIQKWLVQAGLPVLEITNIKDYLMIELWDDRAIQIIQNEGRRVDGK